MSLKRFRVSTEKQAAHGVSLAAQSEKIRAMAVVQGADPSGAGFLWLRQKFVRIGLAQVEVTPSNGFYGER